MTDKTEQGPETAIPTEVTWQLAATTRTLCSARQVGWFRSVDGQGPTRQRGSSAAATHEVVFQ